MAFARDRAFGAVLVRGLQPRVGGAWTSSANPVTPAASGDWQRIQVHFGSESRSTGSTTSAVGADAGRRGYGRGTRTNHPEDYPEYVKGCDIASFDIYPAVHDHPDVAGKLWLVADGVSRLRKWTSGRKPVWNCIECTHISNPDAKATPAQLKAEVWMSLVRGSRGLIYFAHQFRPTFIEAGLLADKEMAAAVGAINRQIHDLAPVLNSPDVPGGVTVASLAAAVPVEAVAKRWDGATYVFAVGMRAGTTAATFTVPGLPGGAWAEVLGENRTVEVRDGVFQDEFGAWGIHLYHVKGD